MIPFSHVIDSIELERMIGTMEGWSTPGPGNALFRRFAFQSFQDAFTWMAIIVPFVTVQDHHPDWRNVFRHVEVTLYTHDKGGVTRKDIALAQHMDKTYQQFDTRRKNGIETT